MMRIGLVRHFKVNHPFPQKKLLSKSEVITWFEGYDKTENLQYKSVNLGEIKWKQCYSSSMLRAVSTANHIYQGEIKIVDELRELDILHRLSSRIKLPFIIWGLIVRAKSFFPNSDTNKFKAEIISVLDGLIKNSEPDTLIVSHWFVMRVVRKELIKRGFATSDFKSNEYGTLYIFERGTSGS